MIDGNANTKENIRLLYEKSEDNQVFGRKDIIEVVSSSLSKGIEGEKD